ncbi:MAG: class I SAM-dependent methyltransferase [Planctomycetaceae bacterium]|jgi:hypothetical protein|nr:class I SAM-dependent methyltransferase [Planctomycetaceae bacterium]
MSQSQDHCAGTSASLLDDVLVRQIAAIQPRSVVDFGAGAGKNGGIVRKTLGDSDVRLVAVEGFEPTVEILRQAGVYDNVECMLIQDWFKQNTNHYDLAIFGDVLEHLSVWEVRNVLRKCYKCFSHVIVIAPLYDIFQEELYGNKLEIHKCYMTETFFNRYYPLEKHFKRGDDWYMLNVYFSPLTPPPSILSNFNEKKIARGIVYLSAPVLQLFGMERVVVKMFRFLGSILQRLGLRK